MPDPSARRIRLWSNGDVQLFCIILCNVANTITCLCWHVCVFADYTRNCSINRRWAEILWEGIWIWISYPVKVPHCDSSLLCLWIGVKSLSFCANKEKFGSRAVGRNVRKSNRETHVIGTRWVWLNSLCLSEKILLSLWTLWGTGPLVEVVGLDPVQPLAINSAGFTQFPQRSY